MHMTIVRALSRLALGSRALVSALLATATILAFNAPASAVNLEGWTLVAEGISDRSDGGTFKKFTYAMEIYFGVKGNRFAMMRGTTGKTRILIPAGSDTGSKRRSDAHFQQFVTIKQTATTVSILMESRGIGSGYAHENFTYEISIGNGSCTVTKFRYKADARQQLTKSVSKAGNCTLTRGAPEGLNDN